VESNHHSRRRQGYSLLSSPMLSVRTKLGWPAGIEPAPTGLTTPGASVYTTTTMSIAMRRKRRWRPRPARCRSNPRSADSSRFRFSAVVDRLHRRELAVPRGRSV
jgi:hypothetical protein